MKALKISEGAYWVGAIDWDLRDFHHHSTHRGSTYNAYLVIDEKKALIDTVKRTCFPQMLSRIEEIINPEDIDYVVANHMEMDHSGALPFIMEKAKKATVIVSEKAGEASLKNTFHAKWNVLPVKEGSEINLGKKRLRFIPIPMLHWPDSMATYLPEDKILFPNDAFGSHYATGTLFDDENEYSEIMLETQKYYATILTPYSERVMRFLEKLKTLPVKMIAPSHGVIWRSNIPAVVENYTRWAQGLCRPRIMVLYSHMWGATKLMAEALAEGVLAEGLQARTYDLRISDVSDIITELLETKGLLVGSSTMHTTVLPPVAAFLSLLKGLKPKGRIGAAFGSYGWGGGAVKIIQQEMKLTGIEVLPSDLSCNFVPDKEMLAKCRSFGSQMARRVKEECTWPFTAVAKV